MQCKIEKLSMTDEEYRKKIEKINKHIIAIETYINSRTKIKHKCLRDGYIWSVCPGDILMKHGCPKCAGRKRRTHNEYVDELKLINPNIEVLETYINKDTSIKHKCLIDGYEWYPRPNNLLRGAKCPKCSKVVRYTTKEFKNTLKLKNPNVEILDEYKKSSLPIRAKCLIDGYIWKVRPGDLLRGYGCPKCGKVSMASKQTIKYEEFINRLEKIHKGRIIHIGKYINLKTITEFKCTIDNHTWMAIPSNIIHNKTGCPICANNIKYSTEKFIEFISSINPEIEILGDYSGKENKIKCRCKVDNYIWYPKAGNLKNKGSKCPICSKKAASEALRLSEDEFIKRIFEINPNLELVSKFHLTRKKVMMKCRECLHIWMANPRDLLYSKSGCPKCAGNKVESSLANLAKKLAFNMFGTNAKEEYRECINPKTGYVMPYDIFINNGQKKYLIEIHGPQHERYIPFFHTNGIKDFEYQKRRDEYKKNWAILKGYIFKVFWVEKDSIEDIKKYFNEILLS